MTGSLSFFLQLLRASHGGSSNTRDKYAIRVLETTHMQSKEVRHTSAPRTALLFFYPRAGSCDARDRLGQGTLVHTCRTAKQQCATMFSWGLGGVRARGAGL